MPALLQNPCRVKWQLAAISLIGIFVFLLLSASALAQAQTYTTFTWNGGDGAFTSANWSDSANPASTAPPGPGDIAVFSTTSNISGDGSAGAIELFGGTQTFSGNITGNGLSGENSASLLIDAGSIVNFGGGSSFTSSAPIVVGINGVGTLNLSGGATATAGTGGYTINAAINLGFYAGGDGTFTLSGSGTSFNASGEINVGLNGDGELDISGGAMVTSQGSNTAAGVQLGVASLSSATISGANSQWQNTGDFDVGVGGYATLMISSGGKLTTGSGTGVNPGLNIAYFEGSFGSVTVDGTNSSITSNDQTIVGNSGTALLTIKNGATMTSTGGSGTGAILGNGGTGSGTVTIDGSNSTWTVSSGIIVGSSGFGQLTLTNGGTLQLSGATRYLSIGSVQGSSGEVDDNGPSSITGASNATLTVGDAGTGVLDMSGGTTLSLTTDVSVAAQASSGTPSTPSGLYLSDSGTSFSTTKGLNIGVAGLGVLSITGGSQVQAGSSVIGTQSAGNGTVTVDGANSSWAVSGSVVVGQDGSGSVTVSDGATAEFDQSLVLGQDQNSSGTLTIDGANSKVMGTGAANMVIGQNGQGTLQLKDGAQFTLAPGSLVLGSNATSTGQINVDGSQNGSPSTFTVTGSLVVGGAGTGMLNITNGGVINTTGTAVIGRDSGSNGAVTISGGASQWVNAGTAGGLGGMSDVVVGQSGTGSLTLSQGATFGANNLTVGDSGTGTINATGAAEIVTGQAVTLGNQSGGSGTVVLDGNSVWLAEGLTVTIGKDGTGSLTIKGGSSVQNAPTVSLGSGAGTGTLAIDGSGSALTALTVLNVGSNSGGSGTINVTNGGQLTSSAGGITVAGNTASITVDGSGSAPSTLTASSLTVNQLQTLNLTVTNNAVVNITGSGTLNFVAPQTSVIDIDSGGKFNAAQSTLAFTAAAGSSLTVGGGGTLSVGSVLLGGSGDGVSISNQSTWNVESVGSQTGAFTTVGANVSVNNSTVSVDGYTNISNATMTVTGSLSQFNTEGIALSSNGHFYLTNNAQAATPNVSGDAVVLTGSSSVIVDSGAQLATRDFSITDSGSSLVVADGAQVRVADSLWVSGLLDVTGAGVTSGGTIYIGAINGAATPGEILIGPGGSLKVLGMVRANHFTIDGGVVGGSGFINGASLVVANLLGIFRIGDPQTLTIDGDYEQGSGGTLEVAVEGTDPADYDHLDVTGNVSLMSGTTLQFDFMNGFAPKQGDEYNFLAYGSLDANNNTFSNIQITGLEPGFEYNIVPDASNPDSFDLQALNNGISATPEPGVLSFLAPGACLLFLRRRRRG